MIGIIIAMESEFIFNKEMKSKITTQTKNKKKFYIYDNKIVFTYSGIGKVNSAISTYNLITSFKIKNLINIGTAGAFSNNLKINDLVLCNKFFSYDVDLTPFNYKIGQMPKEKNNFFLFNKSTNFINNIKKNFEIINGNIASGDSFITNKNHKHYLIFKEEKIDVIDMESWSIANVCDKQKINFISFKVISDLIRNPSSEDQFKINHSLNRKKISRLIELIINLN
ncbi:MAG: 5'-methylthioadenosine/S-adenosylhomocysteine nucleosidase [Mycoplasmoidaceae bacterium]